MLITGTGNLNVCWSYFRESFTADEFDAYVRHTSEWIRRCSKNSAVLTIVPEAQTFTQAQLVAVADMMEMREAERIGMHALVTQSASTRGVATALGWLATKPFSEQIFTHLDPALRWLTSRTSVDAHRLSGELLERAPAMQTIISRRHSPAIRPTPTQGPHCRKK
jgi:hypothetical protein